MVVVGDTQQSCAVDRHLIDRLAEPIGSRLEDCLAQQPRRTEGAGGSGHRAAAHEGAGPGSDLRGVGLLDDDALRRHAQAGRRDLRESRVRALSDGGTRRLHVHLPIVAEPHACGVGAGDIGHATSAKRRRSRARVFDIRGDADSHEATFGARRVPILERSGVAEHVQRCLERGGVVTRLIGMLGGTEIGHLV